MLDLQLVFRRTSGGVPTCQVLQQNTNYIQRSSHPISRIVDQIHWLHDYHCLNTEVNSAVWSAPTKIGGYVGSLTAAIRAAAVLHGIQCSIEVYPGHVIVSFDKSTKSGIFPYSAANLTELIKGIVSSDNNVNDVAEPQSKNMKTFRCQPCRREFEDKKLITKVPMSNGKTIGLCTLCSSTYKCDSCGFLEPAGLVKQALRIDEHTGENTGTRICDKCRTEKYKLCKHCSRYFWPEEDEVCPCLVKKDFKSFILAHNADVLQYQSMDPYCRELFGIEIETGTLNKNRKYFKRIAEFTNTVIANNAILKYDSSIDWIHKDKGIENDYKGFEVVTRPMLYKNAVRFLKDFCKNHHPLLRSWEVGTCGLHIHVSKACLSKFEIGKVLQFINNTQNRGFVKMVAKREDKRFAKFLKKRIVDYKNMSSECHYEAINTSKEYTIEFRIFRGSLNTQTVLSYLQFVKSVIDFVKVTEPANLTYKHYVDYLGSTERSRFRDLKRRLERENQKEISSEGEI